MLELLLLLLLLLLLVVVVVVLLLLMMLLLLLLMMMIKVMMLLMMLLLDCAGPVRGPTPRNHTRHVHRGVPQPSALRGVHGSVAHPGVEWAREWRRQARC